MAVAYRNIALPAAALVGAIILILLTIIEIRRYARRRLWQAWSEGAIARSSRRAGRPPDGRRDGGATIRGMLPRIAIPVPHSGDPEYAARSLPQYERAVEMAGGEPVAIPLDWSRAEVTKLIESCDAVLLPGSKADVDPAKYDAPRHAKTAPEDSGRDTVDELLLQDAYNMRKPILGICYGLQILNVHRTGTLIQHIESRVNHEAGRKVAVAHTVEIDPRSKLAEIVEAGAKAPVLEGSGVPRLKAGASTAAPPSVVIAVNSSHHQAAEIVGDGLKIVARCPEDGIIEALEGISPDHFVLAVQWHPERSVEEDEPSRAIFRALVAAARRRVEGAELRKGGS